MLNSLSSKAKIVIKSTGQSVSIVQAAKNQMCAAENALLDVFGAKHFPRFEGDTSITNIKRLNEELRWYRRLGIPKPVPQVKQLKGKEARTPALKMAITK